MAAHLERRRKAQGYHYYKPSEPFPDPKQLERVTLDSLQLGLERMRPSRRDPHYLVLRARRDAFMHFTSTLPAAGQLDVLDVGGRIQPYRPLLGTRVRNYVALDPQVTGLVDVIGTAESLPFPSGSFDAVICTQVMSYVKNPRKAVAEMHRVLKPGGSLFLTVPAFCPAFFDELWRFFPEGIRELTKDFQQVEIRPEGYSIAGVCRTLNIALDLVIVRAWVRRIAAVTLMLLFNVAGDLLDRFSGGSEHFTANYSILARK